MFLKILIFLLVLNRILTQNIPCWLQKEIVLSRSVRILWNVGHRINANAKQDFRNILIDLEMLVVVYFICPRPAVMIWNVVPWPNVRWMSEIAIAWKDIGW